MSFNAVGGLRDAGFASSTLGYGRILAGLGEFDRLGAALGQAQDRIARSAVAAAARPQTAFGHAPAAVPALSAALAAYASSEAGHASLNELAGAAAGLFDRLAGGGSPRQLRLPSDV